MTHAEYMREWRARHPEHREYMRKWREQNKAKLAAYRRERYEANRQTEIQSAIDWQKKNIVEAAVCRKVAGANARYEGRLCSQDIRDLIERDGWFCHWCKKPIEKLRDFTLEHLEPINDPACIALACAACNSARLPLWGLTRRLERKEYLAKRRDKKREYDKQWKRENREKQNALQRDRYWAHVDERRAYFREWQRKKRERDQNARNVPSDSPSV